MNKSTLDKINKLPNQTLMQTLQMTFTEFDGDSLVATMPIQPLVHQPYGLLHGGASAALAESVGSCLSGLVVDHDTQGAVGINLNIHHLSSAKSGVATAKATFIRKGKSIHVVNINVTNEDGKAISSATLTNKIIEKNRI